MASILRSSKFVRYIAGFAKNVVVNTPREFDGSLVNTASTQCYCGALPRTLATQTSAQHDQNLERRLRTLDQDVKRSGRISRRDIEDVLEEIRNARSATSSQSLLVIRCCGSLVPEELPEVRTKLVQEIWNTLNKLNVPMDVSHYNALLRVYLENEHPFSPTDFLSDMESKGIEPNRVTYQRLISRYCQDGDIEGATKILEYMREKQMPVNENVFNALIFGHSQAGDMDSAHGILAVMTQAGLEPSADTFTTLLCGYAKKGNIQRINELINECEQTEVYLLDKDYLDIVYSLATNGYSQYVPEILSKVKRAIGYNQDAVNLILRLINKGCEEAAFEVMKTMPRSTKPDGSPVPVGGFFIRQLVKADRSIETILEYCNKLEQEKMYDRALTLATEVSLELGKDSLAYGLLEQLKNKGVAIRQHFFWPLIVSKAKDTTGKGIVEVLQKMQTFDLTPNNETIRDWVLPNLRGNSSKILALLRDANISPASSACGLLINLLQKQEITEAATIASSIRAFYTPELIRRPLTTALYSSENIDAYITILRNVYDNLGRKALFTDTNDGLDRPEILGQFLLDLSSNQKGFYLVIAQVLKKVVEQGLSISTTSAEKIENKLGEKMTEEISNLLGKLTSGELTPVPQTNKPTYVPFNQMNIPQLERLIQNLASKNQETAGLKRQLFNLYYREKNLEKMEAIVEELKNDSKFEFTSGIYAQLMDSNAYHGKVDRALEYFEVIKKMEGDKFELDEAKIIRLAGLLIKNGRVDDGIRMLEETPTDKGERGYAYNSLVWRILNSLAEEGRDEDLNKLFDTLLNKDYINVNNVILGPLIKVHLTNNDIDKALDKFEWCVNQFKATPWKNELACKLIQIEDAEKLQRLTDLSTIIHGEMNSLYDLVFAFVECGRIRQARKILETPGLQNRPQRINNACERFQQEGLIKPLEGLKDATKDLNHIDRSDIYYQLLLSYIKQEDAEKCIGLWTQMQEEDLAATDQFLLKLGSFLQEKGLVVPFALPQAKIIQRPTASAPRTQDNQAKPKSTQSQFRQKIARGDLDDCLNILKTSEERISIVDTSHLIEKLIHKERLTDATRLTLDLLEKGSFPIQKVFRFVLNRIAAAGDVESLNKIGQKLNPEVKKMVSFDNRQCHANIVAGKVDDYLNKLNTDIDNATNDNLDIIASQFPRGGAYGILEKHPEAGAKEIGGHRIYCSSLCELRDLDEAKQLKECDIILKELEKLNSQLRFKDQTIEELKNENQLKIQKLSLEISSLNKALQAQTEHAKKQRKVTKDFTDDVLDNEEKFLAELNDSRNVIAKLNMNLIKTNDKLRILEEEIKIVNNDKTRLISDLQDLNVINRQMVDSIKMLEGENRMYIGEIDKLREELAEFESLKKGSNGCATALEVPNDQNSVENVKGVDLNCFNQSSGNKSDISKNRILLLGDDFGVGLARALRSKVNLRNFVIESFIKPGASYSSIINSITSLTKSYTMYDYVLIVGGSNDLRNNNFPKFKEINAQLKYCLNTNIVCLAVPFFGNKVTRDSIRNFNSKLANYCSVLNEYSDSSVMFLETNGTKRSLSSKHYISCLIADTISTNTASFNVNVNVAYVNDIHILDRVDAVDLSDTTSNLSDSVLISDLNPDINLMTEKDFLVECPQIVKT